MVAEVVRMYQAYCEKCMWESDPDESEFYAEREADRHNETCGEDEDEEPEESYQELLDRLLQNVKDNS